MRSHPQPQQEPEPEPAIVANKEALIDYLQDCGLNEAETDENNEDGVLSYILGMEYIKYSM